MKIYVKYKTEISYELIRPTIKFRIKIRTDNDKYRIFKNTFNRYLTIENWTEANQILKGDTIIKFIKSYVKEYLENTQNNQSEKIAKEHVEKMMNSNWKEIELIIEQST